MRIYADAQWEVHEGDTVRYVRRGHPNGKFSGKAGTVVDAGPRRPGAVGVHFPHYPRGINVLAIADDLRLVACPHEDRRHFAP
jgi:hypothetical protein